jgi:hypothetical protein
MGLAELRGLVKWGRQNCGRRIGSLNQFLHSGLQCVQLNLLVILRRGRVGAAIKDWNTANSFKAINCHSGQNGKEKERDCSDESEDEMGIFCVATKKVVDGKFHEDENNGWNGERADIFGGLFGKFDGFGEFAIFCIGVIEGMRMGLGEANADE